MFISPTSNTFEILSWLTHFFKRCCHTEGEGRDMLYDIDEGNQIYIIVFLIVKWCLQNCYLLYY
jgi:hypothetical protein